MNETYLAGVIWRLEHMTEAEHRVAAEQAGRMAAAVGRRWPRMGARRRTEIVCGELTTI
jgi:hypothetical protein